MKDTQFRVLLDLMMVSDPWPLDQSAEAEMVELIHNESKKRGYDGWLSAYHFFLQKPGEKKASPKKVVKRKARKVKGK